MTNQGSTRAADVSLELACIGRAKLKHDQLLRRRKMPFALGSEPIASAALKHADDQTILALLALQEAAAEMASTDFQDWGILAAPRYIGRSGMAEAWQRFKTEGAWGISPHMIPHRSLHSISGTLSLILKSRGPNCGVGDGAGAVAECLLAAAGLMRDAKVPGIWIVLTAMEQEMPPTEDGQLSGEASWLGLALGVTRPGQTSSGRSLRIGPEPARIFPKLFIPAEESIRSCLDLPDLLRILDDFAGQAALGKPIHASLGNGLRLEIKGFPAVPKRRAA